MPRREIGVGGQYDYRLCPCPVQGCESIAFARFLSLKRNKDPRKQYWTMPGLAVGDGAQDVIDWENGARFCAVTFQKDGADVPSNARILFRNTIINHFHQRLKLENEAGYPITHTNPPSWVLEKDNQLSRKFKALVDKCNKMKSS